MIDIVDHTLRLWRSTPFIWGDSDCMLSIGDYVALRGAVDVTARFRGTYADEAGALAHMDACGGMAGFAAQAGLTPVAAPCRGDVVALAPGGDERHVGALCTGDGIAARLERGVIEVNARLVRILGAWACPL